MVKKTLEKLRIEEWEIWYIKIENHGHAIELKDKWIN